MIGKYDLIVVGAGPAGLAAAGKAAEEGLKTIILEKHNGIKAWKPCAEGVSKPTFKTADIEPEEKIIDNVTSARVYAPNGKYIDINEEGYNINKSAFLFEMAKKAAEAGAELKVNTPVHSVYFQEGKVSGVTTSKGKIYGEIVIGADGIYSVIAKTANFNREGYELIPVQQYKLINASIKEPNVARIYLGKEIAPLGYAWIFPKSSKVANVGLGVRGKPVTFYMKKLLKDHRDEFKHSQIVEIAGGAVPISGLTKEVVKDRIILVGDASGTVIPFTGAGIHSSIAAGITAAEVSAEAISEENPSKDNLKKFIERYNKYWGTRIKKSYRVMKLFEKLSDNDLNELAEVLTQQDVIDLANGFNPRRVAKKLLKKPIFGAKLASKLFSV